MFQRLMIAVAAVAVSLLAGAATAAPPPPLEAYGKLPAVDSFTYSPSGARLAFVDAAKDGRAVYVTENGKPIARLHAADRNATGKAGGDANIIGVSWPDEDHVVMWTSKTYNLGFEYGFRHELLQVLVFNVKTKQSIWVFEHGGMVLPAVLGFYGFAHKDGHAYGYFEGRATDEYGSPDANDWGNLYRVDLDSGQIERIAEDHEDPRSWLVSADGAILATSEYDKTTGDWRLFAGVHRGALIAEAKSAFDEDAVEGQGRKPGTVVYETEDADGAAEYFEASLDGSSKRERLFEGLYKAHPLFDDVTGLLIGYTTGGDYPDATFFDPHREAKWKGTKKAFPGLVVSLASYSDDFDHLLVYTDGEGDPGTYWTVDIKTGKAAPLGFPYPDVNAADVGVRKYIKYKAADGLEMEGVLTLPPGRDPKSLPVVVMPHGGPRSRDTVAWDWLPEAFAARGYAVFQPNFRGSTGYGADFLKAGYGEWGRKMQTDVSDGLSVLAAQGVVDPKRACIVGWSYGGYVALAGVTVQHGLYRCAVSMAGVSDLLAMLRDEADKHDSRSPEVRYWKVAMGAKSVTDPALKDLSPAVLAARADAPILLLHGKDDTIVPIEQSRIMERALKGAGKPVELIELDGETHNLDREENRLAMLKAAVAFVEKYNPPN